MAFRFIHTADLHLDSPLRSLALRNADLASLVSDATRQAVTKIVDLCLEEKVDALIIAGDLYDGDQTSMKTARFLATEMTRLHEAGIRTFKIRGNHDALSKITTQLVLPPTVSIFGKRPDTIEFTKGSVSVAIHGLSFEKAHAPESLLPKYRRPLADTVNVGLMHTSLAGAVGHDLYAPCKVTDLHSWGYDYWALGHIHQRSKHLGERTVIMPGMPQGRDINENGPKTISLVTIADDRTVTVAEHLVCVAQFERLDVDISDVNDWRELAELIESRLGGLRTAVDADHLISRVRLTGWNELIWTIRRDLDVLKGELDHRSERLGKTWVEKIELGFERSPVAANAADPIIELGEIIRNNVVTNQGFRQDIRDLIKSIIDDLPAEMRDISGASETDFESFLDEIVSEGTDDVLARLKISASSV